MAYLYVSEYEHISLVSGGGVMVPQEPSVAEQRIAITGTSAASSAFNTRTKFVRVHTDAVCSVKFASSGTPEAVATEKRLASGQTEFFGVAAGGSVAVISNT